MTIELTDEELQEIVKALEAVIRLHSEHGFSVATLTRLVEQLRLHLPGSGVRLRPRPPAGSP